METEGRVLTARVGTDSSKVIKMVELRGRLLDEPVCVSLNPMDGKLVVKRNGRLVPENEELLVQRIANYLTKHQSDVANFKEKCVSDLFVYVYSEGGWQSLTIDLWNCTGPNPRKFLSDMGKAIGATILITE